MTFEFHTTDASHVYRESTSSAGFRFDGTANTGSLFEQMRDTTVSFGNSGSLSNKEASVPQFATGDVKAVFRQR